MSNFKKDYTGNNPSVSEASVVGFRKKRISWPAVFAGLVVAVAVHVALNILGLGVGMGAIDPMAERQPMEGLGVGTMIWYALSMLIALFIGGWIAARLSGITETNSSILHGVLTWGLFTIVSLWLVTTTIGAVVSGVAGVAGEATTLAGRGMEAVAPHAREMAPQISDIAADVAEEVEETVQDPETEMQARRTADEITSAISTAAILAFIGMLLGAGAAAWGGKVGEPKDVIVA